MNKKAVIIGGGIGGLAIGLRLKAQGIDVEVFEKSENIGGKLNQIEINGFRFDVGPSLFTLPHLVGEIFTLFNKNVDDYLAIESLEIICNYYFSDGINFKVPANKNDFLQASKKVGVDPTSLERYLNKQSTLYDLTADFFLFSSIHRLETFVGDAGKKSLKGLPKLDAFKTMHERNSLDLKNKYLIQLFDRYATYNGSNPFKAPATLNMIAHLEHNTGAYFPKNGMYAIVEALVQLANEENMLFHTNSSVQKVITKKNIVEGVMVNDRFIKADIVVNDTDITYFYRHLLQNEPILKKLEKRERSSSALIFYWGVNKTTNLDVHNILFSNNYALEFKGLFETKLFAEDLTVYIFISNKVTNNDAPENCENWFVMVNAPENVGQNWEEEIQKARLSIIKKINTTLNIDIESHIVAEEIGTPLTIEEKTSSVNGSLYGHSSNSAIAAFLRHPNFSKKYKNLYFVGGSVHPGGGIPLCLASAKIVDDLIRKK